MAEGGPPPASDARHYLGIELDLFVAAHPLAPLLDGKIAPSLGRRVLEVGAGIGSSTLALWHPGIEHWQAVEPDPYLARRLQDRVADLRPRVAIHRGTLASLPPQPLFDTLIYVDVLEHLQDDAERTGPRLPRLAPGGRLIVLSPAHPLALQPLRPGHRPLSALHAPPASRRCSWRSLVVERAFQLDIRRHPAVAGQPAAAEPARADAPADRLLERRRGAAVAPGRSATAAPPRPQRGGDRPQAAMSRPAPCVEIGNPGAMHFTYALVAAVQALGYAGRFHTSFYYRPADWRPWLALLPPAAWQPAERQLRAAAPCRRRWRPRVAGAGPGGAAPARRPAGPGRGRRQRLLLAPSRRRSRSGAPHRRHPAARRSSRTTPRRCAPCRPPPRPAASAC